MVAQQVVPATGMHVYDNNVDVDCNACGAVREIPILPGDADGDGELNNQDAALLQRHLLGWGDTVVAKALDVNADGKVNNRDLVLLIRYLNGWDVELVLPQQ